MIAGSPGILVATSVKSLLRACLEQLHVLLATRTAMTKHEAIRHQQRYDQGFCQGPQDLKCLVPSEILFTIQRSLLLHTLGRTSPLQGLPLVVG